MKKVESPEALWGEDKTDPADALQSNNFQMKKCFLSKSPANPRNRRRPRARGGKKGGDNNGKAENGKKEESGEAENGKKEETGETAEKAETATS